MLLLVQAVAGPVLPAPPRPRTAGSCPVAAASADIVVCARDQEAFRLHPVAPRPERQILPRAAVRVGDASLVAEGERTGRPGGYSGNRAMVRLKVPLGQRRRPAS